MNNRRAIVMGASSGIGMAVAKALIGDGGRLGVAARRTDLLTSLQQLAPDRVKVATIDVNSDEAEHQLLNLIEAMGGIDLFFYAPGIGHQNTELKADIEMSTVTTNGLGFTRMMGVAFRYMAEHGGGHIAAITSIAGTKGLGAAPSYSATKAFQNTYLQALEQLAHIRRLNIHFTDIRPGFVDTALLNDGRKYPMLLKPENVAREIVRAIDHKDHVCVVDWRWRIVTALWRLIPNCIWRRLSIH